MNYDFNVDFLSSPHTEREASCRSLYSRDNHFGGGSNRDMDEDDDIASCHPSRQSRFKELDSPLRSQASIVGTIQGGHTEKRPPGPPGPKGDHASMVPEGIATLKPRSDPFEGIVDSRKRKAYSEVYTAFIGNPRKRDPSHVKLLEAGWAMAKRVFHPPEAERWPTKEANTFMAKNLTLIPEQKMELESDLNQEAFLKDFEKNPS